MGASGDETVQHSGHWSMICLTEPENPTHAIQIHPTQL